MKNTLNTEQVKINHRKVVYNLNQLKNKQDFSQEKIKKSYFKKKY